VEHYDRKENSMQVRRRHYHKQKSTGEIPLARESGSDGNLPGHEKALFLLAT